MQSDLKPISARNRRQAMDWSLALASQGIEPVIWEADGAWSLLVEDAEYARATNVIEQYQRENARWHWRRPLAGTHITFDKRSLLWCLVVFTFHLWTAIRAPALREWGLMNSDRVWLGEWWRLFTAVLLHADAAHLVANLTTGLLLVGLAMARFGPGFAITAIYLAGAGGNVAGLLLYSDPYRGLGASGMVMGALGLVTAGGFPNRTDRPVAMQILFRSAAAGVLLLVLLGFAPSTDVVAHVGGFVSGLLLGAVLRRFPGSMLQSAPLNAGLVLLTLSGVLGTWMLAVRTGTAGF